MKKSKINLQEKQFKKLKELGECLHKIRTEQGRSIEAVANKTRIQARLLRAIEEGNLEVLPEPVYIRGLIRQFADALGLNGTEFASAFPTAFPTEDSRSRQVKSHFRWRLPSLQLRPLHLYLLYILLVIVSVQGLSNLLKHSALEASRLTTEQPSPASQPAQKPLLISQNEEPPKPVAQPAKPLVVEIQIKDECWLRVVVDGKTEFEGILREGTRRTWIANEQLTLRAGNAGSVVVNFNDQQAKQLGEPGQVQEVTYQANPLNH